ncbi:MAG: type II toxin-antitoxin system HicA family toxin [Candidatus Sulfotelmatobacter sp.]
MEVVRQVGSHKKLSNPKFPHNYTWAFGDGEDIGPSMLARIARKTGLKPTDL